MPNNAPGTFEIVALELSRALTPLAGHLHEPEHALMFLTNLGLKLPANFLSTAFLNSMATVHIVAHELPDLTDELITAIDGGDAANIVSKAVPVVEQLALLISAFDTIATEMSNMGAVPGISPADMTTFVNGLPKRLFETVLIDYMEGYHQAANSLLELFGIIDKTRANVGSIDPSRPETVVKTLQFDRIGQLFQSPGDLLESLYGWGQPSYDGNILLQRVGNLLRALRIPITTRQLSDARLGIEVCVGTLAPTTGLTPPGVEIVFALDIANGVAIELPVTSGWRASLAADGELKSSVGLRLQPPANITVIPPSGSVQGQLKAGIARVPVGSASNIVLLGVAGGTGLSVEKISLNVISGFRWDSGSSKATGDFGFEGEFKGGKLKISMDGADGFIGSVLSGANVEADFNLGIGWTTSQGVYFIGSSSLEIQLPLHIALGPIDINNLILGVGIEGNRFPISLSTGLKFSLGPMQAVVEEIGASVELGFPTSGKGDIGPLDINFGFKPPKGVGLSIDASVVKGGGYLYFDFDKEEYAGVLELDLSGIVSVKAIGLITTKMPDGSQGFSLLLILTAEFGSPIQLGFGFTLSGVGGLLGLNRTMRLEVIAGGIRDGGINSIMFPQNVVANAPKIISDLKKYFPVEEGTFLIGPMVKIGWGTPNLVTVSLGVIIEIPGNIAILGVLKVALPDEDAALIIIQVNFIGAIEFDKKRLWFFASIFESRVLFITLEGEMGLLVGWGDDSNFVVSVGGFHPAFNPPPLPFGSIARIAISILNTDFARIRVEGYFAVTSNSVQFGAAVELFFGVSAFNIDGHLGFDALFRFSPFYFIITISASLSVKVFGIGLFSVSMRGSLEGPTPWHVEGTGSISLLFFDIDVDFSHTWGSEAETTLPPIAVMPLLTAEYLKLENWLAVLPTSNQLLVSLRKFEPGTADLILHPLGSLKISQRAVPLGMTIDKVGNQKPSDANYFDVSVNTNGVDEKGNIEEAFAVGQYFSKSDSALLNAKSFEPMKGGVELAVAGEQLHSTKAVKRVLRYEQIIIDTHYKRYVRKFHIWIGALFELFLNGNAVSLSVLSNKQKQKLQPFADKINVGKPLYSVAFNHDNTAYDNQSANFTSQVQAQEYMKQQIAKDANLAQQLHVIPQVETQRAA
jgi:hypothetical protein